MMVIVWTILFTLLNAFLYRIGGLSKEDAKKKFPWYPQALVNTKARDIGIALTTIAWLLLCHPVMPWFIYLITFGVTFAALTTYWDSLFGEDNFFFHGLVIGLAKLGCVIITGHWIGFIVHTLVLAVGMWLVSVMIVDWAEDADFEECGRGAMTALAMPLMLIG